MQAEEEIKKAWEGGIKWKTLLCQSGTTKPKGTTTDIRVKELKNLEFVGTDRGFVPSSVRLWGIGMKGEKKFAEEDMNKLKKKKPEKEE